MPLDITGLKPLDTDELEPLDTAGLTRLDTSGLKLVQPTGEQPGRLGTAGSSFVRGYGQIISGLPKALALTGTPNPQVFRNFERIDRGELPLPSAIGSLGMSKQERLVEDYKNAKPAERLQLKQQLFDEVTTAQKSTLYEAGNSLDRYIADNFPVNPEFQEEFWSSKIPQALGSAGGFVTSALLTRGVLGGSAAAGFAAPAGLGSAVNKVDQFEQALDAGADIATALEASQIGGLIGTTEAVPIGNLLNRLDRVSGGQIKRYLARAVQQGTEEAIQESFAGILNEATAQKLYDPERGVWTMDRVEEGAIGFTTGALLETLFTLALPGRRRGTSSGAPDGDVKTVNEVTDFVDQRISDLNLQADQAELSEAERGELEFLRDNRDKPEVLAEAFGVRLEPVIGEREKARATVAPLEQDDLDSPIPSDLIQEGRDTLADAIGQQSADDILTTAGFPAVGTEITLRTRGGSTRTATVVDAFDDGPGTLAGAKLQLDDGRTVAETFESLRGRISPMEVQDEVQRDDTERREEPDGRSDGGRGRESEEGPQESSAIQFVDEVRPQEETQEDAQEDARRAVERPPDVLTEFQRVDKQLDDARSRLSETTERFRNLSRAEQEDASNPVVVRMDAERDEVKSLDKQLDALTGKETDTPTAPLEEQTPTVDLDTAGLVQETADAELRDVRPRRIDDSEASGVTDTAAGARVSAVAERPGDAADAATLEDSSGPGRVDTDRARDAEPALTLEDYTEKSIIIRGQTKENIDRIKKAVPGVRALWNRKAQGWVFPKKREAQVREALADLVDGKPAAATSLRGERIDDEWVNFSPATQTLGIPRDDMPQIKAEHRGALANFLKARGIDGTEATVPALSLKPTQAEFSENKVEKAKTFTGGDRAILVSSDGHVLDGHHQWLAAADRGEDIRVIQLDAPIRQLLTEVTEFPSAEGGTATEGREAVEVEPDTNKGAIQLTETLLNQGASAQNVDSEQQSIVRVPSENWFSDNKSVHKRSIEKFRDEAKEARWRLVGRSRSGNNLAYEVSGKRVEVYKSGAGMGWNLQLDPPDRDWKKANQVDLSADPQRFMPTRKSSDPNTTPIDPNLTAVEKAEAMHELARAIEPDVNRALSRIDSELGFSSKSNYKTISGIVSKSQRPLFRRKYPNAGVEHVHDAFRFKSVLKAADVAKIEQALDIVVEETGAEIIKIDFPKMQGDNAWGWRILPVDLRMRNGLIVEYYFPLEAMNLANDRGGNHALFEKWRDVDDVLTLPGMKRLQYRKDAQESKRVYDLAFQADADSAGLTTSALMASFTSLEASLSSLTSDQSLASSGKEIPLPPLSDTQSEARDQVPESRTSEGPPPGGQSTSTTSTSRPLYTSVEVSTPEILPQTQSVTKEIATIFAGSDVLAEQSFGTLSFTEEAEIEETGEIVSITQNAQTAFSQSVKRVRVLESLLGCVNG